MLQIAINPDIASIVRKIELSASVLILKVSHYHLCYLLPHFTFNPKKKQQHHTTNRCTL